MEKKKTKPENKLTLSVDKGLVEKARKYTSKDNETISGLVSDFLETYIAMKSKHTSPDSTIGAHAAKFAGIISLHNTSSQKEDIADIIISKHQKRFK